MYRPFRASFHKRPNPGRRLAADAAALALICLALSGLNRKPFQGSTGSRFRAQQEAVLPYSLRKSLPTWSRTTGHSAFRDKAECPLLLPQPGGEKQDLIALPRGPVPVFHRRHSRTAVASLNDGRSIPYRSKLRNKAPWIKSTGRRAIGATRGTAAPSGSASPRCGRTPGRFRIAWAGRIAATRPPPNADGVRRSRPHGRAVRANGRRRGNRRYRRTIPSR